jgi:hypothetical protein
MDRDGRGGSASAITLGGREGWWYVVGVDEGTVVVGEGVHGDRNGSRARRAVRRWTNIRRHRRRPRRRRRFCQTPATSHATAIQSNLPCSCEKNIFINSASPRGQRLHLLLSPPAYFHFQHGHAISNHTTTTQDVIEQAVVRLVARDSDSTSAGINARHTSSNSKSN